MLAVPSAPDAHHEALKLFDAGRDRRGWHPGELYPRVGFIVTNLSRPAERVVAFYNQRGRAEQYIKEGKNAIKWTRLSCRKFRDNEVRLQLHAPAPALRSAEWRLLLWRGRPLS